MSLVELCNKIADIRALVNNDKIFDVIEPFIKKSNIGMVERLIREGFYVEELASSASRLGKDGFNKTLDEWYLISKFEKLLSRR